MNANQLFSLIENARLSRMGRTRTRLELEATQISQIRRTLRATSDTRAAERLRFALLARTGKHTLEDLARRMGRSRSTIQSWLAKYKADGLDGLLQRDTPPGTVSPIASPEIQQELKAGLSTGRWTSAAEVATWLKRSHNITRSRKSIYYWFARHRR
jgi:transposase